MAASLTPDQLRALARHGAQGRLTELRNEINAIEAAFPDLAPARGRGRGGRGRKQASASQPAATAADARPSGRRGWNDAQRKAAADRMKAYWAKRKGGKKK
jgi:hypothetical protein